MEEHIIKIEENLLERVKQNDRAALEMMFQQFIGVDEKIHFAEYMGQYGLVLLVDHSFVCLTEKRLISVQTGSFGKVLYQDAFLEDLNSSLILQPSIFGLYFLGILLVISTLGFGILLLPLFIKMYYRINKCGGVFIIKEGLSVYVFVNRNRMSRANVMWRICARLREEKILLRNKN